MLEQTKKLIHTWNRIRKKVMANGRARLLVMFLPFIVAFIGYMIYYEGSFPFAFFSSLKVYGGGFDAGFGEVKLAGNFPKETFGESAVFLLMRICLESSRWMGLYITGTFLFRFIREQALRLHAAAKARQEDAIAVHGSRHYEMLLGDVLGKQAITKNIPEKFSARKHVLAFDSDSELMQYLGEHFLEFKAGEDKQVYLCMHDASHTKYAREGFIISNMAENCARLYWRDHYIRRYGHKPERRIALIGFGHYGQALLGQALMVNVFAGKAQGMEYHVFGDSRAYCRLHRGISRFAAVNEKSSDADSVFFHEDGWENELDLLAQMDRVILCSDDDDENIRVLSILGEEPTQAVFHIRCRDMRMLRALYAEHRVEEDNPDARMSVFGTDRALYTRETILHENLLEMAKRIHARYMCTRNAEPCSTCPNRGKTTACVNGCASFYQEWNAMGLFMQRSNVCAADHMEVKLREMLKRDCRLTGESLGEYIACLQACCTAEETAPYQELEHRRWMRYCFLSGWTYADIPAKDPISKRHPLLRPYDELPEAERAKDMDAYMMLCDLQKETAQAVDTRK